MTAQDGPLYDMPDEDDDVTWRIAHAKKTLRDLETETKIRRMGGTLNREQEERLMKARVSVTHDLEDAQQKKKDQEDKDYVDHNL